MQPIFSRNHDIDKIAFLNWRISKEDDIRNMKNLADDFMMSAIELSKLCLIDNRHKRADVLIFPILTNVNHGIELYLKSITWTLNILLGSNQRIEGSHNIKQIFETVKSKIKLYKGNIKLKNFNDATRGLDAYITELFDKLNSTPQNDNMDFSRYPFDKKYDNHFYVDAVGNVEVDLENFVLRFEEIRKNLESISDYLFYQELNQDW
ncbi:hypothetical protein [Mucilaginibacter flavidus]|uniref:hypothetical protein n=1 Tax=Mucilaginibacter flavidus TaxID=2949309 RepID=UPI00209340B2|nr:hypothetical protein [Mucilaginibacter flavidus]MCO5946619.1 hypothetical protein [Mucilaginibacter flavidus]